MPPAVQRALPMSLQSGTNENAAKAADVQLMACCAHAAQIAGGLVEHRVHSAGSRPCGLAAAVCV